MQLTLDEPQNNELMELDVKALTPKPLAILAGEEG